MAQTDGVLIDYVGSTRDNSAVLDVRSANQGLMVPRVALTTGTASAAPVTSPAASLLIYNTATVGDVTPGYYYWNVTGWVRLVASNATPGTVTNIATGTGLTGGPISTTGTVSLDLSYTDDRYVNRSGDVMTGKLTLHNAYPGNQGLLNIPRMGTSDPTSSVDGDVWYRSNNLYYNNLGTIRAIAHTGSWSAMSVAEGQTATATTSRFMRSDHLKQIIEFHAPNVTLAGENYLSLTGQQITANAVNLASTNVTGILPVANGGTGSSTQGWVDLTTDQTANGIKTWGSQANFSNVLRASNGTAAAPSYSFTNSTGMGMYRSGVNMLSLATGGIERLRMIANGNMGIGAITTPATLVHMGSQADATTASQIMTVESMGFAGVNLIGDRGNTTGEPGGAFVRLSQDNLAVQGIFGIVNTAGQDGSGAALTGTEGNAVVLGNKFPGALHLGTNNTVRMSIASNGTTRLHTYTANGLLKTISGNGTLAIATGADLPSGSGNYIQNQTALQATSNFYISGNGRAGTSFQSPLYTRADAGTVAIRPFSNSITAIQLQNAAGTNILNVDATNARVGIGTAAPSSSLHVNGGQIRLAQTAGQTPFELLSYSNSSSLWFTSGNATQSTIVLSPNYALDWDRGVAISYTPGTTGAIAGVLDIGQVSKNDVNFTHGITRFFTNGTEKMRIASNGDVSLTGKIAFRSSDAWLRLNPTNAFTNGIYVANFFRVDGGIASGGVGTSGAGTIRATSFITSDVGFRISNTATNGTYLRGNGTNYVSSAIQAADLPSGSGNYIQNQNAAAQTTSNYWLSGTGRADAYGVNNTSLTSGKGFSLYNGPATGAPQYGIMFAGVGTYGAHAGVNLDWATYLTMNANNNRGWIFKAGTGTAGNVASISGDGNLSINGRLRLGNSANTELYSNGSRILARAEGVDNVAQFATYGMFLPRTGQTYNLYLAEGLQIGYTTASPVVSYRTGDLRFNADATERMRLTAAGSLGIGTTAPSGRLHVVTQDFGARTLIYGSTGNLSVNNAEGATSEVRLGAAWGLPGVYSSNGLNLYTASGQSVMFGNNAVEYMRLAPNGNLGIGTTSPGNTLHVNAGATAWPVRIQNSSGYIDFGPANTGGAHIYTDRPQFFFNQTLTLVGNPSRINAYSTNNLELQTNGATRMTILNSNGHVGIGTTLPAHKLHVADLTSGGGILIGQYNERFGWTGSTSNIPYMGLRFAGYRDVVNNFTGAMVAGERINVCCSGLSQGMELGFWVQPGSATVSGDGNLVQRAVVFGSGMAAWDYYYLSDRRLKSAEKPIIYGLQQILKLEPLSYTQRIPKGMRESHGFVENETTESFGFIAQDIQKVLPELVNTSEDPDKYLTVSYGKLTPVLVKAIQEQQKLIESQQSLIDELTGRIEALEAKR